MKYPQVKDYLHSHQTEFQRISSEIWRFAELGFQENQSSAILADALEADGFTVKKNIGGIPTAFTAEYGEDGPTIGFLGEYDALPDLGQKPGIFRKESIEGNINGHGCGHNLLGVGSLAAAMCVKDYLKKNKSRGKVVYYGCPAEEDGGGKVFMVKDGAFKDTDIALTWHPEFMNAVIGMGSLATISIVYEFWGRSAHAAAAPYLGRSALDAVELMSVGCNYLREHVVPDARIHYAVINSGGLAPNVVQSEAAVNYYIRAHKMEQVREIYERVNDVARGAALMTGTSYNIKFLDGISDYIPNHTVNEIMHKNMEDIGQLEFSAEDERLAEKYQSTFPESDVAAYQAQLRMLMGDKAFDRIKDKPLISEICPYIATGGVLPSSTDVGDVSQVVPTGQMAAACGAVGTQLHSWQMTSQGNSPIGYKGMLYAGMVMAQTALDFIHSPELVGAAKAELMQTTGGEYISPMPDDAVPQLKRS